MISRGAQAVTIRRMRLEDASWVTGLCGTCGLHLDLVSDLRRSERFLWAADCLRRGPLGFVAVSRLADEVELTELAVGAAHQRQGVASRLLRHVIQRARGWGATGLYLEVRKTNVPAIRLYETFGFVHSGTRKGYYRAPVDDGVLMVHLLSGARSSWAPRTEAND